MVRLNATTGIVDSGFSTEEFEWYGYDALIWDMTQQPDGKLIAIGDFHSAGAATANNVARLETNGDLDPSFSATGAGPSAEQINTVLVRPSDGKIFLGGDFSTFGGQVRHNIAWANPDGSVDNTFAGLSGATEYGPNIWTLATQADGKVVMTGVFTSHDGVPHDNVLRVNPDGTVDSSFDVHTDRSTRALLIQPDGKILIAGYFGEVNGVPMARIARLNSDGTLDPSFDPGTGPDKYYIRALALDSAGNIYVAGEFSAFNGIPRVGIVKLTPNGAVDPVFNPVAAVSSQSSFGRSHHRTVMVRSSSAEVSTPITARMLAGLHESIRRPARSIRPLTPAARVSTVAPSMPCARLRTENITREEAPTPPTMASPDGASLASIATDHSTPRFPRRPWSRETPCMPSRCKMERFTQADRSSRVLVWYLCPLNR